ncbi:MAG TPA: DNA/RNA helicase [Cryomorphaceae bacterium]|nr:DNA/RNA helicase [Owenweeksia sp.]HAD96645.1 DNA/RNA helicase [Cryomorphaceae bacterium]HBF21330.1 DNA/RNA helicase [Cryomorphaceae bacterium]|tara:strand:+ start:8305 stop:9996 length:1692 start_codon:yes stop_codon:yes gene_type:complete
MNYTPEQENIFHFVKNAEGHGIIDAVAGAGKTTTIIASARHVPADRNILFCAFNKSIANEIEARFHAQHMHGVSVKTMHALGFKMLQPRSSVERPLKLVDNKYDQLLKSERLKALLTEQYEKILLINGYETDPDSGSFKEYLLKNELWRINDRLLDMVQKFRATLCKDDPKDVYRMVLHFSIFSVLEAQKDKFREELQAYHRCLQILLEEGNAYSQRTLQVDFTDMLYLPVQWKLEPPGKFDFIFIDECQDLSKAQLAIALKYGHSGTRILSVGDPRQSIYGFTGADIESFGRIKEITKATPLPLTTCFRCPQGVIKIAREIRKDITGRKQEEGVVETIASHQVITRARPGDLIISRLKDPLLLLVFDFIDKDIKVHIHPDEVKELISELRYLFKPEERNKPFYAIPGGVATLMRQVTKSREYIITKNAERIIDDTERKEVIEQEKAYLKKRLDFLEKKSLKWEECATMEQVLLKVKDYISAKENCIRLSTIHRAKGLEEKRVFIIDYPRLPHTRLGIQPWEQTQETNLKYVAVTRAKEELYLVSVVNIPEKEEEGSLFDDLF